jgi:hypothetical protein
MGIQENSGKEKSMDKKPLKKGEVVKMMLAELNVELTSDFDRRENGSIMMAATNATFEHNGEKGHISVDLGGTHLEIGIGSRRWHIKLAELVPQVLEVVDAKYVAENPIGEDAPACPRK